jgi:Leucine-rich repeat (LRR) protein
MKQVLLMIAVVMGQSVLAADVVINDPIVEKAFRQKLKKPTGELTNADLANVTELSLGASQITDVGLKEVAKYQNLTHLVLAYTQITDEGLKEVAKLQKLEQLMLLDTKITDEGAAELKKALPKLELFLHSYEKD